MCMKVEVIKNPVFSFLQLKMWYPRGEFVWVFKSVVCHFKDRDYVICGSVL